MLFSGLACDWCAFGVRLVCVCDVSIMWVWCVCSTYVVGELCVIGVLLQSCNYTMWMFLVR